VTVPQLDPGSWEVSSAGMTVWFSDLEFFEINIDSRSDLLALTLNHVGIAQALLIGKYFWFPDAQAAAQRHLDSTATDLQS
jgi:hypothetical protein